METHLSPEFAGTRAGREAEAILRKCVHCGFCTATCPTYQLLGDELDGPRGRIYLIKQVLEGAPPSEKTQQHLDRCLTCRACETTCPSGVEYGQLLDIGREIVERKVPRPRAQAALRAGLRGFLPSRAFFPALKFGQWLRPLMPSALKAKVPPLGSAGPLPVRRHERSMLLLAGCVQPAMFPNINGAARRVLDALGVTLIEPPGQGCCGAVRQHLAAAEAAQADARRNIDAWWPLIEAGAEAIVVTASGCGTQVKDYGHLLADDPAYARKSARVAALARDISETVASLLEGADAAADTLKSALVGRRSSVPSGLRVAVHNPCSLQHGQQLRGQVETILDMLGVERVPVADGHLCCGSAGTYSLLQPALAQQLKLNKLAALTHAGPALIVSANVGCIAHLGADAGVPVRHWIELLDEALHET